MNFKHQVVIFSFVFLSSFAVLWHILSEQNKKQNKPFVACSTSIIADTVKNIGQDYIDVHSLMGPGIDPHLYKPVENDIINIHNADIIFYNGLHLEARMSDIFAEIATWKHTVAVSKDIDKKNLLSSEEFDEIYDPHIWFDINLWIQVVHTICNELCILDPKHHSQYQSNKNLYVKKLEQTIVKTKSILSTIPKKHRCLITGHDAFSYFGKLYEYKVIGLQGISTESSPGAQDVQSLIDFICDHHIPAIFIESSIPIKNIQALQEGVSARGQQIFIGDELYSDALGPPQSKAHDYIGMVLHNATVIAHSLKKN